VVKTFDGWGASPIDRPDGGMAGLGPLDLPVGTLVCDNLHDVNVSFMQRKKTEN